MSMKFYGATHAGMRRKNNEDRYLARIQGDGSLLLAVADGMGGMPGGEQASANVIARYRDVSAKTLITPELLRDTLMDAHDDIVALGRACKGKEGMGTTLTAALVTQDAVYWVHVGDSRLYRIRGGKLERLTTDHRFLESMIQDGDITPEEARNHPLKSMLDQCVGCPEIEPDYGNAKLESNDGFLLCTDGLHDELSSQAMEEALQKPADAHGKVSALIEAALEAGGRDNVTVIVVV